MSSSVPPCKDARRWVQERLKDKRCFAPFTGQDSRAFSAFVHLLEVYAIGGDRDQTVKALRETLRCAQPSVRYLFKAAIPWVLDWNGEDKLWKELDVVWMSRGLVG